MKPRLLVALIILVAVLGFAVVYSQKQVQPQAQYIYVPQGYTDNTASFAPASGKRCYKECKRR